MRRLASLLVWVVLACGPSVQLGPQITCPNVGVQQNAGECDILPANNKVCSDGQTYEINCGDDGTCTCVVNGVPGTSVLVGSQASGFCASLTASQMHSIAAMCLDPNHMGDYLNLVPRS